MSINNIIGLSYPLQTDGQGGLKLSVGANRIHEQIREILDTEIGERIYRPLFGSPNLIFTSPKVIDLIVIQLEQLLRKWLPSTYVSNLKVDVISNAIESGLLEVQVTYVYTPSGRKERVIYSTTTT